MSDGVNAACQWGVGVVLERGCRAVIVEAFYWRLISIWIDRLSPLVIQTGLSRNRSHFTDTLLMGIRHQASGIIEH